MGAQSFSLDIEDGFTPEREASKNENGFLGNRVDHITKFLVVEEQIQEARFLQLVRSFNFRESLARSLAPTLHPRSPNHHNACRYGRKDQASDTRIEK